MILFKRHSQKDKTIDGKHVVDTWVLGSPGDRDWRILFGVITVFCILIMVVLIHLWMFVNIG